MRISKNDRRNLINRALARKNPEEELTKLLVGKDVQLPVLAGLRADAAQALGDLEVISNPKPLLEVLRHEQENVKRKAAIACAFLGIADAVPIILEQLGGAAYETKVPMLKALCMLQDERAREPICAYAKELTPISGLVPYVAWVLGFLDLAKARGEKMNPQDVWHRLR